MEGLWERFAIKAGSRGKITGSNDILHTLHTVQIRLFSNITIYDERSFKQHSIFVRSSISLYRELGIVLIQWSLAIEIESQLQTCVNKI